MPSLIPVEHDPYNDEPGIGVPVDYDPFSAEQAGTQSLAGMLSGGLAGLMNQPSWLQQATDLSQRQEAMRQAGATEGQIVQGTLDQAINVAPQFVGSIGDVPPPGIRAFHGSPYDFDRFDLSKIGTGEGAQAYGHGLYFAENPAVAGDYKSKLSTLANVNDSAEANTALTYLARNNYDKAAARADLERSLGTALPDTHRVVEAINSYNPGRMYEVNIAADPAHFLDWDKPLSEQPEVLKRLQENPQTRAGLDFLMKAASDAPQSIAQIPHSGESIYGWIAGAPSQGRARDIPGATEALRQAGIPGIKYLDQGSRDYATLDKQIADAKNALQVSNETSRTLGKPIGDPALEQHLAQLETKRAAGPTSNYVVFDDNLINIIKKYGLAGLIAGGAAHFKTTPVDHNPFSENAT